MRRLTIFQCPHPFLASTREEIISALRKKGLKRQVPSPFLDCVTVILSSHFGIARPDAPTHPAFLTAMEAQARIGFDMFLWGYIALAWTAALDAIDTEHSLRIMIWTLRFLWFDCVDPLWRARNRLLHNQANAHTLSLDDRHNTTLNWYLDNVDSVAPRDH
jgi:hypothetical protein